MTHPPGAQPAQVQAWRGGRPQDGADLLADEVPVALVVNGIAHAVMLATPADLDDFALGFALTEGLIDTPADCRGVEAQPVAQGIELHLEVSAACAWRLRARRRSLAGRTGCGLCGTESLDQVLRPLPPLPPAATGWALAWPAIAQAHAALRQHQLLQQATGATHAAAWCSPQGQVLLLREDVGRHNALDKLVGALARAGTDTAHGLACITSRASVEMVHKAAAAGIGALAAASAPTARAVQAARDAGLLLAGFVRGADGVVYAGAHRVRPADASAPAPADRAEPPHDTLAEPVATCPPQADETTTCRSTT